MGLEGRRVARRPSPPASALGLRHAARRRRSRGQPPSRAVMFGLACCLWPMRLVGWQTHESLDPYPYAGRPIELRMEVEIRAVVRGGPELTAPLSVLTDSDHIYVLDPAASGVHKFDRRGRWLMTIGKRGEGPGEFVAPSGMGWMADTLWVADPRLGRLSYFDTSGPFIRSVTFNILLGEELRVPRRALPGARIVTVPAVTPLAAATVDSLPVLLVDQDGDVRDTLAWRPLGQVAVSVKIPAGEGGSGNQILFVGHDLDLRGFVAWDGRGRWVQVATWRETVHGDPQLELTRIATTRDTMAAVRLPLARTSLSREDVRSYARSVYAQLRDDERAGISAGDLARALMQQVARPAKGYVDQMAVAQDGTVWLRRTLISKRRGTTEAWAAYRFGEGFAGFVELPRGHSLMAIDGGLLWTKIFDELGLPTIVGWRLAGLD